MSLFDISPRHRPLLPTQGHGYSDALVSEFFSTVRNDGLDACPDWYGCTDHHGHAIFYADGQNVDASQIAWEIYNDAKLPEGLAAHTSCGNPRCTNIDHIAIRAFERGL